MDPCVLRTPNMSCNLNETVSITCWHLKAILLLYVLAQEDLVINKIHTTKLMVLTYIDTTVPEYQSAWFAGMCPRHNNVCTPPSG